MKTQASPLELLRKFFKDHSQKEVKEKLKKYEAKSYEGPTVQEYFDEFNSEYVTYHDHVFNKRDYSNINLWEDNCSEIFDLQGFSTKESVLVKTSKTDASNAPFSNKENEYALAA